MLANKADQQITPASTRSLPRFVPSIYQVAFLAVLGAILIVGLAPRLDTDLWWHLKVGAYLASHHVVPSRDFMSYTFVGHPWTDHEWLAELMLYGLYSLAGLWGPIVFFALLICATFTLVYGTMIQRGVHPMLALFVFAAAFMASSASWGPRVQMLTLFFLSAYMWTLSRFQLTRNPRLLIVFPLLMVLWTNFHGGFVLGLAILTLTLAGEWINRRVPSGSGWAKGHTSLWSTQELKLLGISLVATFAVTIVNPNGVRQLLYPLTFVLPNAYTNLIEESASPNFHLPVMMVFEAMLLVLIAAAFIARSRLNWTNILFILAFTHLAFSQVRNVSVWAVVISPFVAMYLKDTIPALQQQFPRLSYRRRPVSGGIASVLNIVLLAMVLLVYLGEAHHYVNARAIGEAETQNYPKGAVAYMKTHALPPHVFVSYGWGGYLLWNLYPRYRDFMDSRADTLYNSRMLHAYTSAYAAAPNWKAVLRDYQVQDVLVEQDAPLAQVLKQDRSWTLRYHDRVSVLYSRVHDESGPY